MSCWREYMARESTRARVITPGDWPGGVAAVASAVGSSAGGDALSPADRMYDEEEARALSADVAATWQHARAATT